MHRTNLLRPILAACLLSSPAFAGNASPPDLPGYHSTRDAITTTIRNAPKKTEGQSGYLGVSAEADAGRLIVKEVAPGSPAAGIGVREKDILLSVEGTPVKSPDELRAIIQSKSPGDSIALGIGRSGAKQTLTATLDALSKPMQLNARAVLGVRMASASDRPGIDIIGGDVVEVAPQYDPTTVTAQCAAQVLFTLLCLVALRSSRPLARPAA